jgi:ribosome-associated protein
MTNELETFQAKASIVQVIVKALQDKLGRHIVTMDLSHLPSAPTDTFVVCHGGSDRQVEALADAVEEQVRIHQQEKPYHREGTDTKEWILLDYVNVVVHIFQKQKRDFYALEELWGDATAEYYNSEEDE